VPYHNMMHGCDVMHSVYRLVTESRCDQWVSSVEMYALLISALAHDVGHQGRTNAFLVETQHELAITFNDSSPLENMHASTLFKICAQQDRNVFFKLAGDDYKQARKVCIKTILHTDLVQHFDMIKEIKKVYEVSSDIVERQVSSSAPCASLGLLGNADINDDYKTDILQKNSMLFLELFLHLADVSNPLKPFEICAAWAWRVLDEFFDQGDEEKQLSIPVGMLNDRSTVNRPGSQHGFISFLVAPLVIATVNLFPQLYQLSSQMSSNIEKWQELWAEDAKPGADAVAKKKLEVQEMQRQTDTLTKRFMSAPTQRSRLSRHSIAQSSDSRASH